MPLSSRLNNVEPKNKRAKTATERKLTRQKSTASSTTSTNEHNTSNTSSTENQHEDSLASKSISTTSTVLTTRSSSRLHDIKNNAPVIAANNHTTEITPATTNNKKGARNTKASAAAAVITPTPTEEEPMNTSIVEEAQMAHDDQEFEEPLPVVAPKNSRTPTKNRKALANSTMINTSGNSSVNNQTCITSITVNEDTQMTDISTVTNQTDVTSVRGGLATNSGEVCVHIQRDDRAGYVLAVGENLSNQLGLGSEIDNRKKPQVVKELPTNVTQVASGGMHSACLTQDGIVYTFGCNDEFALGRDNDDEIDKVELPEKCIEITAGDSHCAALSETGVVYAWGTFRDGSGVLGLEQKKIAKKPMRFKLRERVAKISSGADHLLFLTETGEVYTAGNSEHGQLGRVSKYNSCRGGRRGCDMILVPALVRIGKKKELNGHKKVENVWATAYGTFLQVKDSDMIVGFGLNNCYQIGLEDAENRYQPEILPTLKFESKLRKVVGGMHHTLFLDEAGNVYSMGSHRYGGLGHGKIIDADLKQPRKIDGLTGIVDIAGNTNVSFAIHKNGKVYSWGTNYSKQLGQDTEEDYFVPTIVKSKQLDARDAYTVSVGGQHSLFVAGEEKDDESDSE